MYVNPYTTKRNLCPMENRSSERYRFKTAVVLRHFNSEADFHAMLINYSKCGLCLQSNTRFDANSVVIVQLISENSILTTHKIQKGFRSVAVAEVKWCNEIFSDYGFCFEAGLRYYNY